jgi:hypothetical protein
VLHLVDEALSAHLRADIPLDPSIDIDFSLPDKEWSSALTRPTVSVYLWDVQREAKGNKGGLDEVVKNGQLVRRIPLPRVRLAYFVSVWAGEESDEHLLLGRVMRTALRARNINDSLIPPGLVEPGTGIELTLGSQDRRLSLDFWRNIDGRFRPGLELEVRLSVDLGLETPAGPPVQRVDLTVEDTERPTRRSMRSRGFVEELGRGDG